MYFFKQRLLFLNIANKNYFKTNKLPLFYYIKILKIKSYFVFKINLKRK